MELPTVHFPNQSFTDLFPAFKARVPSHGDKPERPPIPKGVENRPAVTSESDVTHFLTPIGPHLTVDLKDEGYKFFFVHPSDELVHWIKNNMIEVNYDSISFDGTLRSDGSVLITARYSQIIGSRWLTIVPRESLPF